MSTASSVPASGDQSGSSTLGKVSTGAGTVYTDRDMAILRAYARGSQIADIPAQCGVRPGEVANLVRSPAVAYSRQRAAQLVLAAEARRAANVTAGAVHPGQQQAPGPALPQAVGVDECPAAGVDEAVAALGREAATASPDTPARLHDAPKLPTTASQPGGATTLITSWPSWLCWTCASRYTVEQDCCGGPTKAVRVELHEAAP